LIGGLKGLFIVTILKKGVKKEEWWVCLFFCSCGYCYEERLCVFDERGVWHFESRRDEISII
jgi:hypothetical protein